MRHPVLKNGMILWKGKSPLSSSYIVLSYDDSDNSKTICPPEFVPLADKLGFEMVPHWIEYEAKKGALAIKEHVSVQIYDREESLGKYKVHPLIIALEKDKGLSNRSMLFCLKREEEVS